MRRAAKYRRISDDREGQALGVERQDEDLDALGQRRGLTFVADYVDNDISASTRSKKRRPDFEQMMRDARAGRFDVIAAYTTGRLTRRPREFEDLIELAERHGVEFEYVRSPSFDLRTAQGRRIARTLAAQDAGEAEETAERVARQKLQAAAAGQWKGGRRPYGYEADGTTVREAEAEVIREASSAILAGASLRGLAAQLNAQGATTSTGRLWTPTELRKVLLRPRNAGLMEHQGEIVGPAAWPSVVDEEQWRAVVGLLTDPGRRTWVTAARRWLLSGLALCGVCGGPIRATRQNGTPSYTCKPRKCVARTAAEVETFVTDVVIERLSRPDVAELLATPAPDRTADLRQELLAIRTRRRSLAGLLADGILTEAEVRREAPTLDKRISEIEATLSSSGRDGALSAVVMAVSAAGADPATVWAGLDLDRRRAVLDALMTVRIHRTRRGRPKGWRPGRSYFDPSTVGIEWKGRE
ncbi:recombinase family protein [Plantactinospora sp. BB1]|uniref:recombinase family protein n=1 Tax=Plantactinospora sp. BB1 TaxID=2071627 RepID=UPI000D16B1BB|nr:recombinase family protein [Plantactinospora sp. BB1]AVT37397.1 hypothetical protein C6W10_14015 [Plantactinospora sp. BB1]